jgi:hypothetical protein
LEERERCQPAHPDIPLLDLVNRDILFLTLVEGLKLGGQSECLGLGNDVVRERKQRATRQVVDLIRRHKTSPAAALP